MTKVLITGGAGFIGYHVTKYLLEREIDVIIYDNFSDYYNPKLKLANATDSKKIGAKIIQGDILDKKKLAKIIANERCERIIHLAAQPGVRYSTINPDKSMRINVEGTTNVLTIARECNIERVVITSSSSVFGPSIFLPMNENHPRNPISYYGASKLTKEHLVDVTKHLYPEFDTVVIRPFTVVGSKQRPDMAINIFVSKAMKKEPITVFGDGTQTRDWTAVTNMAQAFYLATFKPKAKHQTFNIGAGTRISVNSVLKMVSEITNQDLIVEYVEMNKADVKDTFADISKAKHLLSYNPKHTLFEAIEDFTEFWVAENYLKKNISRNGSIPIASK